MAKNAEVKFTLNIDDDGSIKATSKEVDGLNAKLGDTENASTDANNGISLSAENAIKLAGGLASLSFGVGILGELGSKAFELGANFERGNAKVATLFGDVEVNSDGLKNKLLDLSVQSGLTADELNEGLYSSLSAGIPVTEDMGDSIAFLEKMSKLARGGFTSLDSAVDVSTTVLNAYGLGVDQTDKVMDTLITTQNKGKTTVDELASSLAQVVPTAAAMNVEFEQVGAAMATLTAQGTPTAAATTQLNSLFAELGKSGTNVANRFMELSGQTFPEFMANGGDVGQVMQLLTADMGDGVGKMKELMDAGMSQDEAFQSMMETTGQTEESMIDMFGSIEAAKAAMQLATQDGELFAANLDAVANSAGATDEAASTMEDTFFKVDQATAAMNAAFINFYDMVAPTVNQMLDLIIANADWLAPLLLGIATAIGIVAVGFGIYSIAMAVASAATAVWGVAVAIATSPITLLALAVIGVALAVWYFWDELVLFWNGFVEWSINFVNFILDSWNNMWKAVSDGWNAFKQFFIDSWNAFLKLWSDGWKATTNFVRNIWNDFVNALIAIFTVFVNSADNALKFIDNLFKDKFGGLYKYAKAQIDNVKQIFKGLTDFIAGVFTGDWERAWNGVKAIFDGIWKGIVNMGIGAINALINPINIMLDGLSSIKIPDWVPGIGGKGFNIPNIPTIPYLASGGIAYGPSQVMIGEAGPEMVLPLNSRGQNFISDAVNGGNGGNNIEITIGEINGVENAQDLAEELLELIDERLGNKYA